MMTNYTQTKELKTETVIVSETTLASGMRYYYFPTALYYSV